MEKFFALCVQCKKSGQVKNWTQIFFTFFPQVFHNFFTPFVQKHFTPRTEAEIHVSVLKNEVLELLNLSNKERFLDATLGMAGHSIAALECNPLLHILAFDQDPFARKVATKRLEEKNLLSRIRIIPQNFEEIFHFADFSPDAMLFDVGISSLHIDTPERGFSFRFDAPLDMRMNPEEKISAYDIVNFSSEKELENILREWGEEPEWKKVAHAICTARKIFPLATTFQLAECVKNAKSFSGHRKKMGGGHPASLVFQGIRIAVNRELEVLEKALKNAIDMLENGGRLGVISFHSLEDRLVKNIFKAYKRKEKKQKYPSFGADANSASTLESFWLEEISPFPCFPSLEEQEKNPRSRSAKLRVVEKISPFSSHS